MAAVKHCRLKSKYPGYEIEITGRPSNEVDTEMLWRFEHRREWPNVEGIFEPPDVEHCYTARMLQLLNAKGDHAELAEREILKQLGNPGYTHVVSRGCR